MIATVPLAKAQVDNIYQLALSFQNLDYELINYRISIVTNYTNPQPTSFDVNVYSAFTSNIHQLGFRYLVINSNWRYVFYVSYITFTPNLFSDANCKTQSFTDFNFTFNSYLAAFTGLDFDYSFLTSTCVYIVVSSYSSSSADICIYSSAAGYKSIMMY